MNKWAIAASLVMGMALTGCATTVKPSYVSPTQYQALNCTQLQSEYDRIQHYLEQGVEPEKRTGVGVGVGVGGGWGRGGWGFGPTFSVNLGQSSNTKRSEIAQLLGQQDAIVQAAHFKNCRILTVKK
ncbi:hypothetical protein [Acinetobacter brisouii]|jgi:outer membrane lipoprotein SlyB|uniref:hypothetical protein n=1 Tax=Acinetobacter brisouii TaxID=396323 RepID=UPI0005F7C777|nr:hypothetical protein [Acinetobacter brisouii]KJV39435.1 hypothetical protein VH98_05840 [Acinetobacter brisouii]